MITFNDVRLENHETHYFFNASFADRIQYFLDAAGITEYEILKYDKMRKRFPDTPIPKVHNALVESYLRPATAVLISHFNLESLHQKMWEIYDSEHARAYMSMTSEANARKEENTANYKDKTILVYEDKK